MVNDRVDAEIALTIVAPLFDEARIIPELIARCLRAGERCRLPFELVLVDDASTDETPALIDAYPDPRVRAHHMTRNGGQFRATQAGIEIARGAIVVVLDGDLQDPPEDIPRLVEALEACRADAVFAVKERRDDPRWVTLGAFLFHATEHWFGSGGIPRGAGSFVAMRRGVAASAASISVDRVNLAAVIGSLGVECAAIPYEKGARYDGRSRVGAAGLVREALTSMVLSGALHRLGLVATVTSGALAIALAPRPLASVTAGVLALGAGGATLGAWSVHRRWRGQRTR